MLGPPESFEFCRASRKESLLLEAIHQRLEPCLVSEWIEVTVRLVPFLHPVSGLNCLFDIIERFVNVSNLCIEASGIEIGTATRMTFRRLSSSNRLDVLFTV